MGYLNRVDSSSPYSDTTVLGPDSIVGRKHPHSRLPIPFSAQGSWVDLGVRSGNALCHPKIGFSNSRSTQYLSPSTLDPPTTPRLEASLPMLSSVREHKTARKGSYLAPLPRSPLMDSPNRYKEPASRLPSPCMKESPVCLPGSPGIVSQKWNSSLSHLGSPSSAPKHRLKTGKDKALPSVPYFSPGPKRGDLLETLKSRSSSEPTSLRNACLMDDPKQSKIPRSKPQRSASARTSSLVHQPTKRKYYPGLKIGSDKVDEAGSGGPGGLGSLESRTLTPTSRIADDKVVKEKRKSLEQGSRSSYFSTKTSMTTVSEASVKTITRYSLSINQQKSPPMVYTPPNKVIRANAFQTPKGVYQLETSLYYDGFDSSPEKPNSRISITPSLLSSPERGSNFKAGGSIFEDKPFRREDSATSTIYSAATNSTGDIPNLALGIFSDSSTRRIPGAPRLIEVTKNVPGSTCAVSVEEKKLRVISDSSIKSTIYSINSVNMVNEEDLEMRPLVLSEVEKKTDPTTKRVSSYGKTPSTKDPERRILSYGNNPKTKETIREDAKRYLNAVQEGFEGMRRELELKSPNQNTKTSEISEDVILRISPKPRNYTASNHKLAITRPVTGGQLKNITTGGQAGGMGSLTASLGRSHQRVSSAEPRVRQSNTDTYQAGKGGIENTRKFVASEKSYTRPLAKDKLHQNRHPPLSRTQSAADLLALSTKPSSQPSGQRVGSRRTEQASTDKKTNKSLDSLRKQRTPHDSKDKEKQLVTAIGSKNSSRTSLHTAATDNGENPKMDTGSRSTKKDILEITIGSHDSPRNSRRSVKSGVLVDITGIGCGTNPRTTLIGGRNWFGRRSTGNPTISGQIDGILAYTDAQKENARPYEGSDQQYPQYTATPKTKPRSLVNLAGWLNRASPKSTEGGSFLKGARRTKEKSPPPPPNGHFSQEEVDDLIKRLSTQIPQAPGERNSFSALGGRYYTLEIPSLDKSPSKDEKDRNPIAVCMDLINAASNEPRSPRRESLLQMSKVMVDAVSKSRDAECAAEEAKMAAGRAEVAFLETRKHLAEMTELMKHRRREI